MKTGLWFALFLPCFLLGDAALQAQPPLGPQPSLEESLKKARANGKYGMLLAQIYVPQDEGPHGKFEEIGYCDSRDYAGYKNVPAGHWVYVAPYWYIWRDTAQTNRRWGPEQVIGEPDTPQAGDIPTAWASRAQDNQDEWLLLEYETPVTAASVKIYETHNPGSVSKIAAFGMDGQEETIWQGQENPLPAAGAVFLNQKTFARPFKTCRIKLYLDSRRVPGWNEIDAVGLVDAVGKTQWASKVAASSTYAEQTQTALTTTWIPAQPNNDEQIKMLDQALRKMLDEINELRKRAGLPAREPLPPLPAPLANLDVFLGARLLNNFDGAEVFNGPVFQAIPGGVPAPPGEPPVAAPRTKVFAAPVPPAVQPAPPPVAATPPAPAPPAGAPPAAAPR